MYHLVRFVGSPETVDVALNKWITPEKSAVYWPPIKGAKALEKLLLSSESPAAHWKTYNINKIYYSTDDIEQAKRKLKLVEETSDLQTDEEEPKRKIKKLHRYISSSSSDESEDPSFIRPPALKKSFADITLKPSQPSLAHGSNPHAKSSTDIEKSPKSTNPKSKTGADIEKSTNPKSPNPKSNIDECPTPNGDVVGPNVTSIYPNSLSDIAEHLTSSSNTTKHTYTAYQDKVITLLSTLKNQSQQIIEQNKKILEMLKGTQAESLDQDFKLPIKNEDEMNSLEKTLQDNEKRKNLVQHLKSIGGRDLANKISRVMKYLITDFLAAHYNYYGKRSNKKPFSKLQIQGCVVEAVNSSTPEVTVKNVEDQIKTWLKHAPERVKKQLSTK